MRPAPNSYESRLEVRHKVTSVSLDPISYTDNFHSMKHTFAKSHLID